MPETWACSPPRSDTPEPAIDAVNQAIKQSKLSEVWVAVSRAETPGELPYERRLANAMFAGNPRVKVIDDASLEGKSSRT